MESTSQPIGFITGITYAIVVIQDVIIAINASEMPHSEKIASIKALTIIVAELNQTKEEAYATKSTNS